MLLLSFGLFVFLGMHCIPLLAPDWRRQGIARWGEKPWKGLFSALSLLGLVCIVWGYGQTRIDPVFLWTPPVWTRHLAALLVLFAFILITAAYVPDNHIRARLRHPMYAGVKLWAFSHLITNGRLGDVILFGAFLIWSIAGFSIARKRDTANALAGEASLTFTVLTLLFGVVNFSVFAFYLHRLFIGVTPL